MVYSPSAGGAGFRPALLRKEGQYHGWEAYEWTCKEEGCIVSTHTNSGTFLGACIAGERATWSPIANLALLHWTTALMGS